MAEWKTTKALLLGTVQFGGVSLFFVKLLQYIVYSAAVYMSCFDCERKVL